ncbi:MAG: hypothetical protein U0X75_22810 [Acidobacteriota bacterium]
MPVSGCAQSAPPSVFIETERIFNRQGEPFTQFVLTLNRSLQRAPEYSGKWRQMDGRAAKTRTCPSARRLSPR